MIFTSSYLLDDGRIVERGNHETLLKIENGVYNNLWTIQTTENINNSGLILDNA